jgi:signal transduction histidine kinase
MKKYLLRLQQDKSKIGVPDGTFRRSFRSSNFNSRNPTATIMSQSNTSPDINEARLRAEVEEYQKKLTDAAALVARVRHEINNPLAALLGQAQLLLREELSERARKRAETIESQARRIQAIVGELREVQLPAAAVNNQD